MSPQLTEGSLFSGIMGFGEGFRQAGFKNLWAIEKEPFCQAVIRSKFPETELFTDVRDCGKRNLRAVDILTAGFPCQDLSVAGKRAGLEGARSGLFWEAHRIVGELRPAWFVLENVPGLFSSCEGRDFGIILNALDELGYGVAWRVLNSQFFGVAQRRRRVFIVGRLGKPCPAEVLFEPESGGWDIAAGGEERPDIAVPLTSGSGVTSNRPGSRAEDDYNLAVTAPVDGVWAKGGSGKSDYPVGTVATALSSSAGHHGHSSPRGDGSDNLVATAFVPHHDEHDGRGHNFRESNLAPSARGPHGADNPYIVQQAISSKWAKGSSGPAGDEHHNLVTAFAENCRSEIRLSPISPALSSGGGKPGSGYSAVAYALRRDPGGTGQGHNTNYVSSPADSNRVRDFAGLPLGLDSARYRALGNAVTAKVARWLAERIKRVNESMS